MTETERVDALERQLAQLQAMVQALSESHDQNRRELQVATDRAVDLCNQFAQAKDRL